METIIYDYIIIGGGIGGCSIATKLSKKNNILLLEKEPYLGGCSGSFKRENIFYNIGATTFATFEKDLPVYEFFKEFNLNLNIKLSDPAIVVLINGKTIKRYKELNRFIDEINTTFYHPQNRDFWTKVKNTSDLFYKNSDLYYDKTKLFKTFYHLSKSIGPFLHYFLMPAQFGLNIFLPNICQDYKAFIENQLLIVAQAKIEDVNFLTLILSLGYTLYNNYYAIGGMASIFDEISKYISNIQLNQEVINLQKIDNLYKIRTKNQIYFSKNIILNKPIFNQKPNLYTDQSAFVVYMSVKCDEELEHHYQIIQEKIFKYSISNSIFVSISDKDDNIIAPQGIRSITISVHTKTSFWENLSKEEYKIQKQTLEDEITKVILEHFRIFYGNIINIFSATPRTFGRYLKRKTLGGIPLSFKNILMNIPSQKISNSCFYVGDTTFPAQGWPGVIMGTSNLQRIIDNG